MMGVMNAAEMQQGPGMMQGPGQEGDGMGLQGMQPEGFQQNGPGPGPMMGMGQEYGMPVRPLPPGSNLTSIIGRGLAFFVFRIRVRSRCINKTWMAAAPPARFQVLFRFPALVPVHQLCAGAVRPKVDSEAVPSDPPVWACVGEAGSSGAEAEAVCSLRTEVRSKPPVHIQIFIHHVCFIYCSSTPYSCTTGFSAPAGRPDWT